MKYSRILIATALVVTGGLSVAAPAYAHRGGDDSAEHEVHTSDHDAGDDSTSSGSGSSDSSTSGSSGSGTSGRSGSTSNSGPGRSATLVQVEDGNRKEKARQEAEAKRSDLREKLTDKKKKACEAHERQIVTITGNIVNRNQKRFDKITTIYDRIVAFYESTGTTAENYDTLVAGVETKKQAALAAIATIKNDDKFTCDGPMPRQALLDFRTNRLSAIKALIEYRTAVKQLIAAVKAAQPSDDSTKETTDAN